MKKMLFGLLLGWVCAWSAQAATIEFAATLTPDQEVPPVVGSSGSGTAALVLDTDTGNLGWVVSFEGLTSNVIAAHFHKAPVGEDGPVQVDLVPLDLFGGASALGRTAGIFAGGISGAALAPAMLADLMAGLWYLNIHTVDHPGGEIRGQVLNGTFNPVPIPAAAWLMVPALGVLGWRRRG
ncbi:MAG: CHRD domain-containing protein [Gammaproteobacteria bacterium]